VAAASREAEVKLGKVIGSVVSTIKHEAYQSSKLLLVQPLDLSLRAEGPAVVAIDTVGAGAGETVVFVDEGRAARDILPYKRVPVRTLVVGIVDQLDLRSGDSH